MTLSVLKLGESWQPGTTQSPSSPEPLRPPLTSAIAVVDSSYTISKAVAPLLSVIRPSLKPQTSRRVVTVQSLNHVQLFATPWTAAHQVPLSSTTSQSLLKFMSIELMMLFNHLVLCCLLLLLPSVLPSIRDFPSESALHIRWPKYRSFGLASILCIVLQHWTLFSSPD